MVSYKVLICVVVINFFGFFQNAIQIELIIRRANRIIGNRHFNIAFLQTFFVCNDNGERGVGINGNIHTAYRLATALCGNGNFVVDRAGTQFRGNIDRLGSSTCAP